MGNRTVSALATALMCAFLSAGMAAASGGVPMSSASPGRSASTATSFSTPGLLSGVAATSGNDVWAVGTNGGVYPDRQPLVLHRSSGSWSVVPVADPAAGALGAVAATSATNAWAVGASGPADDSTALVLHWDGKSWTPQYSSGNGTLFGVAALSESFRVHGIPLQAGLASPTFCLEVIAGFAVLTYLLSVVSTWKS